MSVVTANKEQDMGEATAEIPKHFIYEMSHGKPIYYKGYRDVLGGTKTFESIMGDSTLQGWLKTRISHLLIDLLEPLGYDVISGELGIKLETQGWRAADVAIFKAEYLELNKKYAQIPPEIIIEIDVQADTEEIGGDMKYIRGKVDAYLENGVQKVIWVFTEAETVITCTQKGAWNIESWDQDISIKEGISVNLVHLLEKRRNK